MLKETIIVSVIVFGILTISSTDGKPRSNLFARRSEGNWTRTWGESETPSAQNRRLSSASHARRAGASERKLAASWFYFSWKIEKEEKEKKENEDKKKDSQRNEKK